MRLLIADKLHPQAVAELRTLPIEVVYEPEMTRETLESKLDGIGVLVVRSTRVSAKAIENAKHLHLIVRAGAETTNIEVKAASERGIYVANCPGKNASAVAELVMGMVVALDRRIPDAVQSLRDGKWERAEYGRAEGLHGKRMGIAGYGAIGREVAARAKAFGLRPVVWSRSMNPTRAQEAGVGYAANLEELARRSDVLSMHLALNERTAGIVGERVFAALPKGAMFLNTARAGLVDEAALRVAVRDNGLRAAVDVYSDEPRGRGQYSCGLLSEGSTTGGFVYGTPHIAASTDQAQLEIARETVRVIRSFLLDGVVPNVVNVTPASHARFQLVIRMYDKVGTLANVLAVVKRHAINVEEITNTVFEGSVASCAKLRLLSRPNDGCLAEIRAFDEVMHVDVVQLPNLA